MHDVPERADLTVADRAEDPDRLGARAVRVMRFEQDAYVEVPAYSAAVPSRRAAVASASSRDWSEGGAGEDADEAGAEVTGQVQETVDLLDHGLVVARRGHPRVPGDTEDLDSRRLELGHRVGPFREPDTGVHRLLRMRAQFYAVIAVRGREP